MTSYSPSQRTAHDLCHQNHIVYLFLSASHEVGRGHGLPACSLEVLEEPENP